MNAREVIRDTLRAYLPNYVDLMRASPRIDDVILAQEQLTNRVIEALADAGFRPVESAKIRALHDAIHDSGPNPRLHAEVHRRSRSSWPLLWRAIDALLR